MTGLSPHPASPVELGTVVPLAAARPRKPVIGYHLINLRGTFVLLVVTDAGQIYLFPPEILSLASDLLHGDMAGLVQEGGGVDVTALFAGGRTAALHQAIAICRARPRPGRDRWQRPRGTGGKSS